MPAINAVGSVGYMPGMYSTNQNRISLTLNKYDMNISANAAALRANAVNPSQPNLPVQPVEPVGRVTGNAAVRMPVNVSEPRLPTEADLNNAQENLVRMFVQYPESVQAPMSAQTSLNVLEKAQETGVAEIADNVSGIV